MTLEHAYFAEAQANLKASATSQGYVIAVKRTKRVGRRKEGDVKVLYYQGSQSNVPVVRSGQRESMRPSWNSGRAKQIKYL